IPPAEHYGDFWQVDNGVGLTRSFLMECEECLGEAPVRLKRPTRTVFVTGMLAGPMLEREVLPRLDQIGNLSAELRVVPNRFYGESVTVSGLLTGQDIIHAFQDDSDDAVLLLPPNCLNGDGLFLDDLSPKDLGDALGRRVLVCDDLSVLWRTE
ncbi:MAG: DUF512 domain-containing protein, partial [bacterium]